MSNHEDYVCIRECYTQNHLYQVGSSLIPGHKPNKHFADTKGKPFTMPKEIKITVAGDDPRSTVQIIKDIKKNYGHDLDEDTSRKDAFALELKLKKKGQKKTKPPKTPVDTKTKPPKTPVDSVEIDGALAETKGGAAEQKPLSKWTPDEIDKASPGELSKLFGISYQGKKKEALVKEILNAETI